MGIREVRSQESGVRSQKSEWPRRYSMSSVELDRRRFLEKAAGAAAAFTILPRHVLGGPQFVAPSDKVTLAYTGVGTQGIRELLDLLPSNDIQVVAVCDPNKDSNDYVDWSKN